MINSHDRVEHNVFMLQLYTLLLCVTRTLIHENFILVVRKKKMFLLSIYIRTENKCRYNIINSVYSLKIKHLTNIYKILTQEIIIFCNKSVRHLPRNIKSL